MSLIDRSTDIRAALRRRQGGFLMNPFRFGGGGGGGDPDFSNVSALLHFEGANGSTVFSDSSSLGLTYSRTGTPTISTAQSKFGLSSGTFAGGSNWIETPSNLAFKFGSGDFTVEAFIRQNSTSGFQGICGSFNTNTSASREWGFYREGGTILGFQYSTTGTTTAASLVATFSFAINTWYHVAICRQGTNLRWFVNGTAIRSDTGFSATIANAGVAFRVGAANPFGGFNGFLDEVRVTKGVARYTADFTPPTAAFPDS